MWRKGRPVLFSGREVFNRCKWMHQHDRSSKPKRHHSSNVNTISIFDQCERMAASAPNTESRTPWQYFWTCSHTNSEGTRAPQALSNHLTASVLSALCSTIQARLSSGIFSGSRNDRKLSNGLRTSFPHYTLGWQGSPISFGQSSSHRITHALVAAALRACQQPQHANGEYKVHPA